MDELNYCIYKAVSEAGFSARSFNELEPKLQSQVYQHLRYAVMSTLTKGAMPGKISTERIRARVDKRIQAILFE